MRQRAVVARMHRLCELRSRQSGWTLRNGSGIGWKDA